MTSPNGNIFRVTGPLWGGIHRSPVNSPHKSQWRGALMFYLICAWINGWVNNGEAGDLRRQRAMTPLYCNGLESKLSINFIRSNTNECHWYIKHKYHTIARHGETQKKRSSGWQLWYSLETLKLVFNVSCEYQGCRRHFQFSGVAPTGLIIISCAVHIAVIYHRKA